MKKILKNKILKLKIIESSRLELDSNVIHPFVKYVFVFIYRVHFVDKNTGGYLERNS
jgi:hypothetical protein